MAISRRKIEKMGPGSLVRYLGSIPGYTKHGYFNSCGHFIKGDVIKVVGTKTHNRYPDGIIPMDDPHKEYNSDVFEFVEF